MTREEAAELLETHNAWRRGSEDTPTRPSALGEALETAIAALRESAEPAELTKDQYIRLSNIFHQQHDEWAETKYFSIPTASFTAVVGMVEEYMQAKQRPALDDLPVEDVALIEMWREWLEKSFRINAITITLSDGKTLYTVKNQTA